ncbi:integral membrane protein [Bisporella sp. PMI_857]|nr:integral membrane protein [Bisporella sp. PMI_857]
MRKPPLIAILLPLILIGIGSLRARHLYYRDPTSCFFDRSRAYDRSYSKVRQGEADTFVNTSALKPSQRTVGGGSSSPPVFCIGIPTVARPTGHVYIRTTIGSLLAGLSPVERDAIHLMPFIAHSDPEAHPIYTEPWLKNVADGILTYQFVGSQLQHIRDLEKDRENREKQIFDYAYMLEACLAVNASYIMTFEDDVIVLDGWFHKTREALRGIEEQVKILGLEEFFYLRLFYTEQSLGWNAEFWHYYLFNSIVITAAVLCVVFIALRKTPAVQRNGLQTLATAIIYCALGIGFFFACGRVSMFPMPYGIQQMPKYACCAQGLVYNPARVPRLIKWYREKRLGWVDNVAEELADTGEVGSRWALTPSVVQHVGTFSTKGEDEEADKKGEVSVSQQRWNFAFELNDAAALRAEHEKANQGHNRI